MQPVFLSFSGGESSCAIAATQLGFASTIIDLAHDPHNDKVVQVKPVTACATGPSCFVVVRVVGSRVEVVELFVLLI